MSDRIRVPGYSQRIFFNDNIEYRPFSSNLVGQQSTNFTEDATFTMGNFNVTTNVDTRLTKNFNTKKYSNYYSLTDVGIEITDIEKFLNRQKLLLKLDRTDLGSYAYFGSLKEYLRVSLENIIIKWPAGVISNNVDYNDPGTLYNSYYNAFYDSVTNVSTITIIKGLLLNPYSVNFSTTNFISTETLENELRDFTKTFSKFEIPYSGGTFPIINFTDNGLAFTIDVTGDLPSNIQTNESFIIKPNGVEVEKFFKQLSEFESYLLNRSVEPIYTAVFDIEAINEFGVTIASQKEVTWPVTDGYNIEFNSEEYFDYVNSLIELADINDSLHSDIIARFLVSNSLLEFDTVPVIINENEVKDGQKINTLLKIYGRSFDEVKKYVDGLSFAHVVTYDEIKNTPDEILKNLATVMGWDVLSSPNNINFLRDLFQTNDNSFDGLNKGMTQIEMEYELWRRLILNTPWLWKAKGTRKGVEFLTKFLGIPDGLLIFNEHVYSVANKLSVDQIEAIIDASSGVTATVDELNIDSEGYPLIRPNTDDMYFQKAGLWYRETGGPNSNVDIHTGNNPHIGPYDGGQAYVNQFKNIIPDFTPVTIIENIVSEIETNIFTNNDQGEFNIIPDTPHVTITNVDGLDISDYLVINNYIDVKVPAVENVTPCGCIDTSTDGALVIEVSPAQVLNECKYTGFSLGEDGVVIFTYPTGDSDSVTAECCKKLGFTPELGPKGYNICRWQAEAITCANFQPLKPDEFHWYFMDSNGVVVTQVPFAECCPAGSTPTLHIDGTYECRIPVISDVCDGYTYTNTNSGGLGVFQAPDGSNTTIVPSSVCCTRNNLFPKESPNGWTCALCQPYITREFNDLGYAVFTAPDGSTFTEVASSQCCPSNTLATLVEDTDNPTDPDGEINVFIVCKNKKGGGNGSGCRYLNSITAQPNQCSGALGCTGNVVGLLRITVSVQSCNGLITYTNTWDGTDPTSLGAFAVNNCVNVGTLSISPNAPQRVQLNWGSQSCPPPAT